MSARTGYGVQNAVNITWRGSATCCAEAGAIPGPRFLDVLEIVWRDLIRWRIARVGLITAQVVPFAVGRTRTLSKGLCARDCDNRQCGS